MAFTYVTVTADYDTADGLDPSGTVTFTATAAMVNAGVVNFPAPVTRSVDVDGQLSVDLAANTDPATLPAGVSYLVLEQLNGTRRSYYVTVPHAGGSSIDLSTLTPATVPPTVTYPAVGPQGPAGPTGPAGPSGNVNRAAVMALMFGG